MLWRAKIRAGHARAEARRVGEVEAFGCAKVRAGVGMYICVAGARHVQRKVCVDMKNRSSRCC